MWEAVRYGDVDYDLDRRALDALIAAVPPEMQFSLTNKRTAKEDWDAIAAARIGSDRARKSTLQALRKEWENLAFKPGEDVDEFALRLNTVAEDGAVLPYQQADCQGGLGRHRYDTHRQRPRP